MNKPLRFLYLFLVCLFVFSCSDDDDCKCIGVFQTHNGEVRVGDVDCEDGSPGYQHPNGSTGGFIDAEFLGCDDVQID